MGDGAIEQAKAALRVRARAARDAVPPLIRAEAAERVAELFHEVFFPGPSDAVAGYWALRDELDCKPILNRLMSLDMTVLLPAVTGQEHPLDFRVWEQGAPLFAAGFGTLAPSPLAPRAVPDVILIPLLGFDRFGTRLGYGGGYYDRTLASLPKRPKLIGLAFSQQELPLIPRETHDVPLDLVLTPGGVRRFGTAA